MSLSHHPNIVRNGLVAYFDAANPKSYPAGQDPYVSGVNLLFDGESLVDKSAKTQSFTNNSSVTVSTTQKKFGNSSLYFSGRTADGGSNSYLSFAANSDFGFGSGDWTVETWFYKTTPLGSLDVLFDNRVGAGANVSGMALYIQAGVVKTGNDAERLAGATIATGVWNHLMISRSGNNIYLGVNGTVVSTAFSTTLHSAPQLYVGNSVIGEYAGGYMDDYRVTKGFARYTANYTVPAATFSLPGRITDLTTNKVIGTLTNGPTYSGGSLVFNGTSSYITLGTNSNLNFGTGDFTIDCWYKLSATTPNDQGILNDTAGTFSSGSVLFKARQNSSGGKVSLQAYDFSSVGGRILTSSTTIAANIWYNATVTRIGNSFTLYINGRSESTGTFAGSMNFNNNSGTYIGYSILDAANGYLNGNIPMIKIYKGKGLSSSEILQNYNAIKSRYG